MTKKEQILECLGEIEDAVQGVHQETWLTEMVVFQVEAIRRCLEMMREPDDG